MPCAVQSDHGADYSSYSFLDGAGDGNRTHVFSLEGCCSTIELHPRRTTIYLADNCNSRAAIQGIVRVQHFCDGSVSEFVRVRGRPIGFGLAVFQRFGFRSFRGVRLHSVRWGAKSVESLWTILIGVVLRFRARGLDCPCFPHSPLSMRYGLNRRSISTLPSARSTSKFP